MTKRYKLLKEHPYAEIHSIWYETEWGTYRTTHMNKNACLAHIRDASAPKDFVEKATSWFQEIKEPERIGVKYFCRSEDVGWFEYRFGLSNVMPKEKAPAIKQAIENVLNEGEDVVTIKFSKPDTIRKCIVILVDTLLQYGFTDDRYDNSYPKYTQEQLNEEIEKAFYAGRKILTGQMTGFYGTGLKYKTFQDYLSSLKK